MHRLLKSILAAAAMVAGSALANAADFEQPAPEMSNWTGFYIGFEGGGIADESDMTCDGPCFEGPYDTSLTGILVGGYAGYNFQMDRLVLGIEGDINAVLGDTGFENCEWAAICSGYQIDSDFFASIRGRLGFLVTEHALLFVTGGWAFTDYDLDNPGCSDCSDWGSLHLIDGNRDGPTFGGGIEYELDPNWHLKLEYLFADFGSDKKFIDDGCCDSAEFKNDLDTHIIRAGFSWHPWN
jgi:outer membrane immunogenic protein